MLPVYDFYAQIATFSRAKIKDLVIFMAALEGQHKYHRVFLHLTGHSNLKQTYRVNDECQMKSFQAVGEKHSVRILFAFFSSSPQISIISRSASAGARIPHQRPEPPA